MQAWLCEQLTGVEGLRWQALPTPEPSPGQVRIRVQAASLNFPDLLTVHGKYQVKPPLPFVPGSEFSGVVEALGDGVRHLAVGDRVASIGVTGGFASHACVDAAAVMPLPADFDLDDAAAFAFTYGTSHHALIDRAALQAGETVLVLGAAGGVGSAAIQIAKAAGAPRHRRRVERCEVRLLPDPGRRRDPQHPARGPARGLEGGHRGPRGGRRL